MSVDSLSSFAQIEAYVVGAVRELFATYGRDLDLGDGTEGELAGPAVMSVIGFAAEDFRGSLLLLSPRETVVELVPLELRRNGPPEEHALRDMLGELSNMLVGRLKNRLLAHGVEPLLSTPTTVLGDGLVVPPSARGTSAWYRFAGGGVVLLVRLDATFDAAFAMAPADAAREPLVKEGEMILF